jgi:hypothetical protein
MEAQIISQFELARAIMVLVIIIVIDRERNGDIGNIKTWRS